MCSILLSRLQPEIKVIAFVVFSSFRASLMFRGMFEIVCACSYFGQYSKICFITVRVWHMLHIDGGSLLSKKEWAVNVCPILILIIAVT